MALIAVTDRSPADGATNNTGSATLTLKWTAAEGCNIYDCMLYYRLNGGAWQTSTAHPNTYTYTHSWTISVSPLEHIEWYATAYWTDLGGGFNVSTAAVYELYGAADTTDPTITSVTPATGNVAPGSTGVVFAATVADNISLANAKLYIDSVLKETWTSAGAKTRTELLTLGAHTYEWTAEDSSGNTATTGVVNITVINVLPAVPSGTITVAGQTGAVEVANLGNVAISWPAFADGNPENTITYTLEEKIGAGAWTQVATSLSGLTYEWIPNSGLGAAELRVKANDGTGDSSYLSRASISIVSSQTPNAPTLTSPAGGESWREGEIHNVTWTPASPEHPEGLPCVYEIQFSADGTFTDAVTITTEADDGSYPWTLATDLV